MTKENKKLIFFSAAKLFVFVVLVVAVCVAAFSQRSFGWFAKNDQVKSDGITVTVDEPKNMNFGAAYIGNFKFGDQINFNIEDPLPVYPSNYVTVVFSVMNKTDFAIVAQEQKLDKEKFDERFEGRRDLLLGDYTFGGRYFDVESVFAYADYEGGTYERYINGLPARPSISMAENSSAFDAAYKDYLDNSFPLMRDFLYEFSRQNSLHDAMTFSLYVDDGTTVTQYLLLPDDSEQEAGAKKYVPAYCREAGTEEWSSCDGVVLEANYDDDSITYALVLGYGTEFYYIDEGELVESSPVIPVATVSGDPYSGTYYSNNYNCFIGSSFSVKLAGKEVKDEA